MPACPCQGKSAVWRQFWMGFSSCLSTNGQFGVCAYLLDIGVTRKILSSKESEDSDINHMSVVKFLAMPWYWSINQIFQGTLLKNVFPVNLNWPERILGWSYKSYLWLPCGRDLKKLTFNGDLVMISVSKYLTTVNGKVSRYSFQNPLRGVSAYPRLLSCF